MMNKKPKEPTLLNSRLFPALGVLLCSGFLVGCGPDGRPKDYVSCLEKVIFETKSDTATSVGLGYCEDLFPGGERAFREGAESSEPKKDREPVNLGDKK